MQFRLFPLLAALALVVGSILVAGCCGASSSSTSIATTIDPTHTVTKTSATTPPTAAPGTTVITTTRTTTWSTTLLTTLPTTRATTRPTTQAINCVCDKDTYNCGDPEAKTCFDVCKARGAGDIHRLDGDKDGSPCNGSK